MQGLTLRGTQLEYSDKLPEPSVEGEAVIRLSQAGICATDLELIKGYMNFQGVIGHEWVGRVDASPDPKWIGRRVVGDINCPCRRCETCLGGRPTHCPNRTVLGILGRNGAFSDRFSLPVDNLHEVPDAVSDDAAVFVEPLAAALQILEQIHIRPSDTVHVLGVGRLGQLCARVLALTGARVSGISRNPERLALLPSSVHGVLTADVDVLPRANIVVDCTGNPKGLQLATALCRPRGTIVMKTTVHLSEGVSPTQWVIDEQTIIGSRCGPFAPALRLLASGAVDPTPLISSRFKLTDGLAAMKAAAQKDCVKAVLTP